MREIEDLLKDISISRDKLERLINEHEGNLIDPEVVAASEVLNAALNKYNEIIDKKMKKEL